MKIAIRSALLVFLVVCGLSACWNGRLVVCAEPPFWASLGEPLAVRASLAWRSLVHGYWPGFLLIGPQENPRDRLSGILATGRFATAVVGPMLSFEPAGFAQGFTGTRFILVDGLPDPAAGKNTVLLVFDRADAFRAAGEAARLSLEEAEPRGLIGVIAVAGSVSQDAEVQGFLQGAAGPDAPQPVVREIEAPLDAAKVKAAVADLRAAGVEIFLPRLAGLDAACLEALRDAGGCAVTADWAVSGARAPQVFLSIEEDVVAGIGWCLGRAGKAGSVVQGPVRIVCGKARQVPAAMKGRVECR